MMGRLTHDQEQFFYYWQGRLCRPEAVICRGGAVRSWPLDQQVLQKKTGVCRRQRTIAMQAEQGSAGFVRLRNSDELVHGPAFAAEISGRTSGGFLRNRYAIPRDLQASLSHNCHASSATSGPGREWAAAAPPCDPTSLGTGAPRLFISMNGLMKR